MITMKYIQLLKTSLLAFAGFLAIGIVSSCDENIEIGTLDESKYITTNDVMGFLTNDEGKRSIVNVEFRNEGSVNLYLNSTKRVVQECNVALKYDASVLKEYNARQETEFEALPENLITMESNGVLKLSAESDKSSALQLSFHTSESLSAEKTYVIPLKASAISGQVKLSAAESSFLIFVKDKTKTPSCDKASGIKIISCMEINKTNPLNNLCFTLKKTGQPLIDIVVLFSANINYSAEKGRVYVNNNKNVQHILNNRDKYIKPLQDKGMKVVLGILGNGDHAGLMSLSDETARNFAQELKATCEAYQLDGVFFDEEWSEYSSLIQGSIPPCFVYPSRTAASRLCYETKQAMPDKLLCIFSYGGVENLSNVDGKQPGEYIDYGIRDYEIGTSLSSNYPGLPKSRMAVYSQEFERSKYATSYDLKKLREDGYGANMIFALDPFSALPLAQMENMANILFDDELVYDEQPYKKDW